MGPSRLVYNTGRWHLTCPPPHFAVGGPVRAQVRFLSSLWWRNPSVGIYIYCAFMSMVVYDDVVLVKWLCGNVQRKAKELHTAALASQGKKSA